MAKITNKTTQHITLQTGHVVPRMGGVLVTENSVLRSTDNWPTLNAQSLSGQVVLEFDPEEDFEQDLSAVADKVAEPKAKKAVDKTPADAKE